MPVTRLLIIHKDIRFAVTLKQSLESYGGYDVAAFTAPDAALEYLRRNPHDLALIDFSPDLVKRLQNIQPDLAIIANPDTPEVNTAAREMRLMAVVDLPISMRDLLPVLRQERPPEPLPETDEAPPIENDSDTTSLDDFVAIDAEGPPDSKLFRIAREAEESMKVFEQLAAEEPPMPEGGTISELRKRVEEVDPGDIIIPAQIELDPEDTTPLDTPDEDAPVRSIIEGALDETMPLDVDDLLAQVERRFPERAGDVRPLPSWVRDMERYVQEPDFLQAFMPAVEDEMGEETQDIPGILTEMMLLAGAPEEPVQEQDEVDLVIDDIEGQVMGEAMPEEEAEESSPFLPEVAPPPAAEAQEAEKAPPGQITLGTQSDDPEIAQLALNLTQVSLELTAEATLLARYGEIVAYSGTMPLEDVEQLRGVLEEDWETASDEARIRFVDLPEAGGDYMLYTCRTAGDYALSMIFLGTQPFNAIRRQSNKLLQALESAPQQPPQPSRSLLEELEALERMETAMMLEEEAVEQDTRRLEVIEQHLLAPPPVEDADEDESFPIAVVEEEPEILDEESEEIPLPDVPRTAYTYLWLIRDPEQALSEAAVRAIQSRLRDQLRQDGWDVKSLNAHEDYVYLFAEVPGDPLANEIMPDLKQRSADIAAAVDQTLDPDALWADSYCVLTPGREMHQDEIQRFIEFGRAR